MVIFTSILIITRILACYGKFNSYRIAKLGAQNITEIFQYISNGLKVGGLYVNCSYK